jgi:hypothetical protein
LYTIDEQGISSVAGRHSSIGNSEELVTFYNSDISEISYKTVMPNAYQFRVSETSEQLSIYPNPAQNSFKIELPNDMDAGKISIFNFQGQLVYEQCIDNASLTFDVSTIPSGIYQVQLTANDINETTLLHIL